MRHIEIGHGEYVAHHLNHAEGTAEFYGAAHMAMALEFADVEHGNDGIGANIDLWAEHKMPLIERMRKSPDWHEDILSIVKESTYSFERDYYDRRDKRDELLYILREKLGEKGGDCEITRKLLELCIDGNTGYNSGIFTSERITEESDIEFVKNVLKYPRVQTGMKCSRLMQKIIAQWDDSWMQDNIVQRGYNEWTETISEAQAKYKFVLSVNPADYLLMSYGNGWTSCQIINPELPLQGEGYSGQARAGTLSYMLDATSAVSYVVDADTELAKLPYTPKIMRQVVFLDDYRPRFFQSRMYPAKDNSGHYPFFSDTMKGILSEVFDVDKKAWVEKDKPRIYQEDHHHYPDYSCFSNVCHYFEHADAATPELTNDTFYAGKHPYCITCGGSLGDASDTLYCSDCFSDEEYTCSQCGARLNEDDVCWANDEPYCNDCVSCCDDCNDYYSSENGFHTFGDNYVCERCADRRYNECHNCGIYVHRDDSLEGPDSEYYCPDCYDELVTVCASCEEHYFREELDADDHCEDCAEELRREAEEAEEADTFTESEADTLELTTCC